MAPDRYIDSEQVIIAFNHQHLIDPGDVVAILKAAEAPEERLVADLAAVRMGKISAIKELRRLTQLDLKQGKELAEAIMEVGLREGKDEQLHYHKCNTDFLSQTNARLVEDIDHLRGLLRKMCEHVSIEVQRDILLDHVIGE